jgi:hypothetical protein
MVWAHVERGDTDVLAGIPSVLVHLYQSQVIAAAATTAQTLLDDVVTKCEMERYT